MSQPAIDLLPYLCLKRIFEFLNLRDLVKCREVSRQFKFYADQIGVDELVVRGEYPSCIPDGYLPKLPNNGANSISLKAFSSVELWPIKLNQQLKFLYIDLLDEFDIEILNVFQELVHFEAPCIGAGLKPKTLILPKLKLFSAHILICPLTLNTPNLQTLMCEEIERIRVEHPETIKRLSCVYLCENHLTKFQSLERLEIRLQDDSDLNGLLLSDWKDLKELHFTPEYFICDKAKHKSQVEKYRLADFLRQRAALTQDEKRAGLKLYLCDVLLLNDNQLADYENLMSSYYFQFKYYRLLRRDSYPESKGAVNFNDLMKLVELSDDFFIRFPRLRDLTANGPVNRTDLKWFLKNMTALSSLILSNVSLEQTFINSLPSISSQLTHLEINERSGQLIDFNFILQIDRLWYFSTNQELDSFDLAANAFQRLKELVSFQFRAGDERVGIRHRFFTNFYDYWLSFDMIDEKKACNPAFRRSGTGRGLGGKLAELPALYDRMRGDPTAGHRKLNKFDFFSNSQIWTPLSL